ncbi:MAG: hypothetical protein AB1486_02380 [Planctomycetota bacterium]
MRGSPLLPVVWLLGLTLATPLSAQNVTIEIDEGTAACVLRGASVLRAALEGKGHSVDLASPGESGAGLTILVGVAGEPPLEGLPRGLEEPLSEDGFALATDDPQLLVIAGGGPAGALYGCLIAADLVAGGALLAASGFAHVAITERPAVQLRAVGASMLSPLGGDRPMTPAALPWLYDESFWSDYLGQLAAWRFDTILMEASCPMRWLTPEALPDGVAPLARAEIEKNREAMRRIQKACSQHGVVFFLGFDPATLPGDPARARGLLEASIGEFCTGEERLGVAVLAEATPAARLLERWDEVILPFLEPHAATARLLIACDPALAPALSERALRRGITALTVSRYNDGCLASDEVIDGATADALSSLDHHVVAVHASVNLAPFRWGVPLFVAGCVRTIVEAGASRLLVMPIAPTAFPHSLDLADPPLLAHRRDWIWYEAWSRYAWLPDRADQVEQTLWQNVLSQRYGNEKAGKPVYEALDAAGGILPRIATGLSIGTGEETCYVLGATLEQLMHEVHRSYVSRPGTTPQSDISRQTQGEPDTGELFFEVLNEVTADCNTVFEKLDQAGRWIAQNKAEHEALASDLFCARLIGKIWWARSLAAYDATAYLQNGGPVHRDALLSRLAESVTDFADLAVLLETRYRDVGGPLVACYRPFPLLPASGRIGAVLDRYRAELARVQANVKALEDAATPEWMKVAIRAKLSVDIGKALLCVPENERENSWLVFDSSIWAGAARYSKGYSLEVLAVTPGHERVLLRDTITGPSWKTHIVSLREEAGRTVSLRFHVDPQGDPLADAVLLGDPRVVTGRLPGEVVSWALGSDAVVVDSLLDAVREDRVSYYVGSGTAKSSAAGLELRAESLSDGEDARPSVQIVMDREVVAPVVIEMTVALPPALVERMAPRSAASPGGEPASVRWEPPAASLATHWEAGGEAALAHPEEAARGIPLATLRGHALTGAKANPAWIATKSRYARGEGRIAVSVAAGVDSSAGAETVLGFGSEASVLGLARGPAYEIVALGRGEGRTPLWKVRYRPLPSEERPIDAAVEGIPPAGNMRYQVTLQALSEGGIAAWIGPAGAARSTLPTVLTERGQFADGRIYLRHQGSGEASVESVEIRLEKEALSQPAVLAACGPAPPLSPYQRALARADALAQKEPFRPVLRQVWEEEAARGTQELGRILFPANDLSAVAPRTTVTGTYENESLRMEHLLIDLDPGYPVTADLYLPKSEGPFRLVLVVPDATPKGMSATGAVWQAIVLAQHGLAALVPDWMGRRERALATARHLWAAGLTDQGLAIRELRLCFEALATRDDIEERGAIIGEGGNGGSLALFAAVLDERFEATALLEPLPSLHEQVRGASAGGGPPDPTARAPGLGEIGERVEWLGLLAPRPLLLVVTPQQGGGTDPPADALKRFYHVFGADSQLTIEERAAATVDSRQALVARAACLMRATFGLPEIDEPNAEIADWEEILAATRELNEKEPAEFDTGWLQALAERASTGWPPAIPAGDEAALITEVRARIGEALGPAGDLAVTVAEVAGSSDRAGGFAAEAFVSRSKDGGSVLSLLLQRPDLESPPPVAIVASERGLAAALRLPEVLELLQGGTAVCAVSLTGQDAKTSLTDLAVVASWTGATLLRYWIDDLRLVMGALAGRSDLLAEKPLLIGEGAASVAALLAAVEDERFGGVVMRESIVSFRDLFAARADLADSAPLTVAPHAALCVPGVLRSLDLDQAAAALGTRPLFVIDPVDGRRQPLGQGRLAAVFPFTRKLGTVPLQIEASDR